MSENFTPLSSQLGVTGTSYRLQLGKIGNKWGVRIIKGKEVVASTPLDELNGNMIVGFVIRETAIPNLNPYSIMKTVQFLTREAKSNEERMKTQGIPAPTGETKTSPSGTVTSNKASQPQDKELMSKEDVRASYRILAKPQAEAGGASQPVDASNSSVQLKEPKSVSSTGRKLKAIPGAGASGSQSSSASKPGPDSSSKQVESPSRAKMPESDRLNKLEDQVTEMKDMLGEIMKKLDKIDEKLSK